MLNKLNRTWLSNKFDSSEKVIFVHVPKCGGTSLDSLIKKNFKFNRFKISAGATSKTSKHINEDIQLVRGVLLNYAACLNYKYISGHVYMHNPEEYEDYKIITILRNPAERFVSHYLYNRYKTHSSHDAIDIEFEDFLATDLALEYGNLICRYFSTNQTAKDSIATLEKFSKVGILENLSPIEHYIKDELNLYSKIKKENKSPIVGNTLSQTLLLDHKEEILKICSEDIDIYKHFESKNLKSIKRL